MSDKPGATSATHRCSGFQKLIFDIGLLPLCYFIFFLSGAAALIYEISWTRQIGLLFGHTVQAAAVVLGSYFAGMGIGYAVGGRYASRVSPLVAYGIMEVIIAMWSSLIPSLLFLTESSSLLTWLVNPSPAIQTSLRGAFCFLLLLPSTTALGATLPFMAELLSPRGKTAISRISIAYAFNTAGAFVGVVCATLFLLVIVGVRGSSYFAAGLSAFSGVMALVLARRYALTGYRKLFVESDLPSIPEPCLRPPDSNKSTDTSASDASDCIWWSVIAGLCGFATLALEILYTRLFSLVFHNSTYTFGAVIAVFLIGLALGAAIVPLLSQRMVGEKMIGVAAWAGAIAIVVSVLVFVRVTELEYFNIGESFRSYLLGGLGLVTIVVLPPVVLLGVLLPLVWRSFRHPKGTGQLVGNLTMFNTFAAAVGSVSASFVLLPIFGLWSSFGIVALVFLLISLANFIRCRHIGLAFLGCLTSLPLIVILGTGSTHWMRPSSMVDEEIIRRWESAYGWIDVVRSPDNDVWKLRQNLHYRHGATGDNSIRERRQTHIPILLHQKPHDVLFLGLGTGVTASAALPFDEIENIKIVELIPEVVEAARLMSQFNKGVVDHPKVEVRLDDARHDMLADEQRYDVIISDLFVPWESLTGYLYTVQHYRLVHKRLKSGGLFCQWLPLYQLGSREFELIADSFASVFPETTLWWGSMESHGAVLALVGSNQPIHVDIVNFKHRFELMQHQLLQQDPYLRRAGHLFDLYFGKWDRRDVPYLNTDEHPRVEFLAPRSHRDQNLLMGKALRQYFDTMLVRLQVETIVPGIQNGDAQDIMKRRRAIQKLILFGE
ncbi:MAG: spermidine synthase [Gimesia sp.]|nr:spermidine synthase [Gimesia sp.]|tara:strand:- start:10716 stop:13214 length:2499 start_codon:yes stop_codon:yes gene_type:complete